MDVRQRLKTYFYQPFVSKVLMKWKAPIILTGIALLLSLCQPRAVMADIFQYTDDNGVIHFSNVGVGNSKKYKKLKSTVQAERQNSTAPQHSPAPSRAPLSSSNYPSTYVDIINTACGRHGVDPALVHALVKVESDFNPYALSRKGAMGLMQLMPETALVMNVGNSFNPNDNIDGGVKYLRYLIDRYEGNLQLALAAYNSGETAVKKWGTIPPYPETQNYVQRIMKIYNGNELAFRPRHTIYMYHGEDGALMLTDDPSKQKNYKRKTPKNL
jgi:soluble lytic murein transglycosylase-like protein